MAKKALKYHRLSPNESVALIVDEKTGKKNWRHRFVIKNRSNAMQQYKDYPPKKFDSFAEFEEYITNLEKPKGFVI